MRGRLPHYRPIQGAVGRAIALPPPGRVVGVVPPGGYTQPADVYAADQAEYDRHHPGPDAHLVRDLLNGLRRMNVTAGPPAHIKPQVWSEPVDQSDQVTLAAAVIPYQTVCSFVTPPGRMARITHYGVNVTDPTYQYDGTLEWRFRQNGRVLDLGMADWSEQRGSMVFMRPTVIIMKNSDELLEFQVRRVNAAGPAYTVQMCFRGWTWRLRNNYEGTQASVTAY
jgi:hypothetical protein